MKQTLCIIGLPICRCNHRAAPHTPTFYTFPVWSFSTPFLRHLSEKELLLGALHLIPVGEVSNK